MEKPFFDDTIDHDPDPSKPLPSRGPLGRRLGLGLLLTLAFAAGYLVARWQPGLPIGIGERAPAVFSLLRVEPPGLNLFGAGDPAASRFEPFLQTQVELIKSPTVLAAALASDRIARLESVRRQADPERWLRESLRVSIVPGTYLIRVSAAGGMSPEEQAAVINEIITRYLHVAHDWSSENFKFLRARLIDHDRDLLKRIEASKSAIIELELGAAKQVDDAQRQADRARIKFLEKDLEFLEGLHHRVALEFEQLDFGSRNGVSIVQIDAARAK